MRFDMTPILNGKSNKISFTFDWEGAAEYFTALKFVNPIHITGNVVDLSGHMLLTLKAEVEYETECARCLEKIHRRLTFDLEKNVALKNQISEDDDDTIPVINASIELDEPVRELLFLELPSRDLCSDDCRGLCPKCGKNLNYGDCGCNTKEINPRLAGLKKFLDVDE